MKFAILGSLFTVGGGAMGYILYNLGKVRRPPTPSEEVLAAREVLREVQLKDDMFASLPADTRHRVDNILQGKQDRPQATNNGPRKGR